jgi:hypothetical protein
MHDEIKKFTVRGELKDSAVVTAKERMVHFLEGMMRDKGCVPSLDLDPQFTVEYVAEKEVFKFDLSIYGIWVGAEKACKLSGVTNGKEIPRYTPPAKSKAS